MTELPDKSNIKRLDETVNEPSEFGAGVVICLAKFAEHFENRYATSIGKVKLWIEADANQREAWVREARRFPYGDAANLVASATLHVHQEDPIDAAIEMWANAASDHFYDLDRERAPAPLRELAGVTLRMGHSFHLDGSDPWTWDDWLHVRELFKQSCLELDRALGVPEPDWGCW